MEVLTQGKHQAGEEKASRTHRSTPQGRRDEGDDGEVRQVGPAAAAAITASGGNRDERGAEVRVSECARAAAERRERQDDAAARGAAAGKGSTATARCKLGLGHERQRRTGRSRGECERV